MGLWYVVCEKWINVGFSIWLVDEVEYKIDDCCYLG